MVVALVKQHGSNLQYALRTMTWAALGYICFLFISGYIISVALAFKNPEIVQNQWEMIKLFSSTTPWDNTLMLTLNIIALSGALAIGLPGLFLLKISKNAIDPSAGNPANPHPDTAPKRIS